MNKHGHLLAGVAKRSRVLSYLSVALGLSKSFSNGDPAYLALPGAREVTFGAKKCHSIKRPENTVCSFKGIGIGLEA